MRAINKIKTKPPKKVKVATVPVTFTPTEEDIISKEKKKELFQLAKTSWNKEAKAYLTRKYTDLPNTKIISIGGETIDWIRKDNLDACFVYEHLLKEHGLDGRTVSYYRKKNEDFDYLISLALELQEMKLARLMLRNKVNTQAAVFVLKNKHGWTEKTQLEVKQNVVDAVQEARQRIQALANENITNDDNELIVDVEYTVEDSIDSEQSSSVYTVENNSDNSETSSSDNGSSINA